MPFGLGFFATAGVSAAAGSFDLLETQVLGTAVGSVTFSSLGTYASTYQHLQVRLVAKDNRGAASSRIYVRLNGSTTNYIFHTLGANGSSAYSVTGFTGDRWVFDYATGSSGNFGAGVIDLLDAFETTKNKTVRGLGGQLTAPYSVVSLDSGAWFDTAATSSITIGGDFGDLLSGSRFSLYGIKAA
jgi:hypothetical protein